MQQNICSASSWWFSPLPAHSAIEARHHTLAELAPRPVVARLAPALQHLHLLHSSSGTCMCPSGCTGPRVGMGGSRFLPHSFDPGSLRGSHTRLDGDGLTGASAKFQIIEAGKAAPGAEQLPPFMHCGEQTGKLQSSPSQPGRQMHLGGRHRLVETFFEMGKTPP